LDDEELDAVVAHECWHAKRRDNLAATAHIVVETLFWFHPVVWWIGRRLIDERERACDEAVVNLGARPSAYASGILKVCRAQLNPSPRFAAAISGSDLTRRVEAIMQHRSSASFGIVRTFALTLTAVAIVATPLAVGAAGAHADYQLPATSRLLHPLRVEHPLSVAKPVPSTWADTHPTEHAEPEARIQTNQVRERTPDLPDAVEHRRLLAELGEYLAALEQARLAQRAQEAHDARAIAEFRRGALSPDTPGLVKPIPRHTPRPTYTAAAQRARLQGVVELEAIVGPGGQVERVRMVRGIGATLGPDEEARKAAMNWQFEPATLNGQPVAVWCRIELSFKLE
jgi:TonB family protein